jgi:hypothetical protein
MPRWKPKAHGQPTGLKEALTHRQARPCVPDPPQVNSPSPRLRVAAVKRLTLIHDKSTLIVTDPFLGTLNPGAPAPNIDLIKLAAFVLVSSRTVREGVSTDSLKFHAGLPCPTLILPAGGRPASVFFPLGYPFPYGPGLIALCFELCPS